MARGLPWFKFCNGDWMKDPALRMCSAATRGIWIDLVCAMYERKTGSLRGTPAQLARIPAVSEHEMLCAIDELKATGTADVSVTRNAKATVRHKNITPIVTLTCRRIDRACHAAQLNAERQVRHRAKKRSERNNERVTPKETLRNGTESESELYIETVSAAAAAAVSSTEQQPEKTQPPPKPAPLAQFPRSIKTIRGHFPATDDHIASRIVGAARTAAPALTDGQLSEALQSTHVAHQRSAALWIQTVPTFFTNGCPERAGPESAFDRRLRELVAREKKHARAH